MVQQTLWQTVLQSHLEQTARRRETPMAQLTVQQTAWQMAMPTAKLKVPQRAPGLVVARLGRAAARAGWPVSPSHWTLCRR